MSQYHRPDQKDYGYPVDFDVDETGYIVPEQSWGTLAKFQARVHREYWRNLNWEDTNRLLNSDKE